MMGFAVELSPQHVQGSESFIGSRESRSGEENAMLRVLEETSVNKLHICEVPSPVLAAPVLRWKRSWTVVTALKRQ